MTRLTLLSGINLNVTPVQPLQVNVSPLVGIKVELSGARGPRGASAIPSQRYDFTAVAGQSRLPGSGPLIDNDGKPFAYGLNFATLIVNNQVIAPELYSYGGAQNPVVLAGGFVLNAGDKVTVIGQPYAINQTTVEGGDSEGVPLHSYPGTTVAEDPERWEHSNRQLEQAQDDTLNPLSANYGKWIDIYAGKGEGKRHADEWTGTGANAIPSATDIVSGAPIKRKFLAEIGDTLLDSWSQNGRYEVADFPTPHDKDNLPGNLRSGVRIRLLPGARVRRAPRYTGVSYPQDILRPLILACDPNPTTATTVGGIDTQSDVYIYPRIVCIGDSGFIGENHRWGYREHHNDISLNAASDFYIETNHYGTISDALYLGAGNIGGGSRNRHNKRGTIAIVADGRNQNNRNVVSIIDCVGLRGTVRGYNFSRAGGSGTNPFNPNSGTLAPGNVDVEPNDFTDDPRIDDIEIDVYAEDCGASAVATLLINNNNIPHPLGSMKFTGKAVRCTHGKHTLIGAVNMKTPYRITVEMDSEDCGSPFEVLAGQGCTHRNGRNLRSFRSGLIGYSGFASPQEYWRENEIDQELGSIDSAAIQVRGWNGGGIRGGQMINGRIKGYHLLSNTGTSPIRDLLIDGLEFINRPNITSQLMQHAFYNDPSNGGAQIFPGTITERDVSYNGILNERWAVSGSRVKNIPGFGIWDKGEEVYADYALEPGAPYIMRVAKSNTSGVPYFAVQQQISGFVPDSELSSSAVSPQTIMASSNMLMSKGRFTVTDANAIAVGTNVGSQFSIVVQTPFSGTQAFYVGVRIYPAGNPIAGVTYTSMYLGVWFSDTTGGQLGRAVPVLAGAPGGAPFNFKYGDTVAIFTPGNGTEASIIYTPAGGSPVTIFSSGINTSVGYQPMLIGSVVGETVRVQQW